MPANKFQILLTDIANLLLCRSFHVRCELCPFEVKNLSAQRFAVIRGKMHAIRDHHRAVLDNGQTLSLGVLPRVQVFTVWSTTPWVK